MQIKILSPVLIFAIAATMLTSCSKNDSTPAPVANFSYSGEGIAPSMVTFTNTSTNATSYLWDFGDNGTSTQANPTHTYTQGGVYTVKLTTTGNGGSNSTTKTVNIATPTSVKITGLKVTAMSFLDPGCSCGWDANSGPDVFFELTDNANNILATGTTFTDVTQQLLPVSWNFATPYQVTNFAATYKIFVYDQDTNDLPPNPDDPIGGYSFSFSSFTSNGYPTTITLQNPSSELKIDLTVQWQ